MIASVFLVLVVAFGFYPAQKARTEERMIASAREQSHLMESIRAATTIKLMGREAEREGSWRNLYAKVINATVSVGKYQLNATFLQNAIIGVQTVLVIYFGAKTIVAGGGFSTGMLFAFLSFRQTFTDRTLSLVNQAVQFRLLNLHLDRLSDIVTAPVEVQNFAPPRLEVRGALTVSNLSFRYGSADPWILQGFNLDIAPGEFLAVTGTSGGGKTTLMKLLLGLQHPTEGQILLDGQVATPELWRAWRSRVGVVAQDDRLLSGSIADNIGFFDPDLDMNRVMAAAQAAQVHADVIRMPMQYQSLIGDMGSSLSGGQRQRVLLARALYRQPSILFLDEGTANLDEATEAMIADLIAQLPITRVVVAHRAALIKRASRVLTLERAQAVQAVSSPRAPHQLTPTAATG